MNAAHVLAEALVPQVGRACALIDDNRSSETYGCADRTYWYYRTITNFPGATWQQLMLGFACLFRTALPSNPHYGDPRFAEHASALLQFWAKSQHRDGAFDEWYLNEHSYCPTAITAAGAALTMRLLGNDLSQEARTTGLAALERSGRWLERRYNREVANQNLAAAVALQGLACLLPDGPWGAAATAKLERIRQDQTSEGWFPEYAGADLGYSTLALDFLAMCCLLGAGQSAESMARQLYGFLAQTTGAGSVLPGRLGSRGTSHAFVFGALHFGANDPVAAELARTLLGGLALNQLPAPATIDDRYFSYFYFPQFALAMLGASKIDLSLVPAADAKPKALTALPKSGFIVMRGLDWSLTTSSRLGGALVIERPKRAPLYHLGYEVTVDAGKRFSSATWDTTSRDSVELNMPIVFSSPFRPVSRGVPLRRLMVPFQLIVYLLRSSSIAARFQALIKRIMIAPQEKAALVLERRIEIDTEGVRISDRLIPRPGLGTVARVEVATAVSMHSPSARQDKAETASADSAALQHAAEELSCGRPAMLIWAWDRHADRLVPVDGSKGSV